MIFRITKENAEGCVNTVPHDLLEAFSDNENLYGIAVAETGEDPPCAALVFEVDEEVDEEGVYHTIAILRWLYVEEEYRQRGIATALFAELLNLTEDSGVEAIRADVPFDPEYDLCCVILEDIGFHFGLTEDFTVTRPLSSLAELPLFREKSEEYVKPLKEIPDKLFVLSLSEMHHQQDLEDFQLSDAKEDYEQDVSCAIWQGDYPSGLLLTRMQGKSLLKVCFLGMLGKGDSEHIRQLLIYAGRIALRKYGSDIRIQIRVRRQRGADLVEKLIPDAEPLLIRRGYFYF